MEDRETPKVVKDEQEARIKGNKNRVRIRITSFSVIYHIEATRTMTSQGKGQQKRKNKKKEDIQPRLEKPNQEAQNLSRREYREGGNRRLGIYEEGTES